MHKTLTELGIKQENIFFYVLRQEKQLEHLTIICLYIYIYMLREFMSLFNYLLIHHKFSLITYVSEIYLEWV